jgi:muconolactone delta-isomerase
MEYLVTMTTHVPPGTSDDAVTDMRAREAAHSHGLVEQGALLRLWRPPLAPGEWRTFGLFAANDAEELEKILAGMPLRVWRSDEVTPLAPHPHDPPPDQRGPRGSLPEFFTIFTVEFPAEVPAATVDEIVHREAVRAAELAANGAFARIWRLPAEAEATRALGLWRAADDQQLETFLDSLPMSQWMVIETIPLSVHPSDPAAA